MKSLYPHQELVLNKLKERELSLFSTTIVDLICGSGKSLIISRLCMESEINSIIVVNKYSINQWSDLMRKEGIVFKSITKNYETIDDRYKVNLVLDEMYNKVIDCNHIYSRIVIDEVSKFVKKNVATNSLILLSYTFQELLKLRNDTLVSYDNNDLYGFYFHSDLNDYLIPEIKDYNEKCLNNYTINTSILQANKRNHINMILSNKNNHDKYIIYVNGNFINELEGFLTSRLHNYLLINNNLRPEGLKRIQSTFNKTSHHIIVINTSIGINGISFSNANNIIFYNTVDDITKKQCLGRVLRMTNTSNIINVYNP